MRLGAVLLLLVAALAWWVWPPEESSSDGLRTASALRRGAAEAPGTPGAATATAPAGPLTPARVDAFHGRLVVLRDLIDRDALESLRAELVAAAAAEPEHGRLQRLLCEVHRLCGDLDGALAAGRAATELLPDSSWAHLQHAKAVAEQMKVGGLFVAMRELGTYKDLMARAVELPPDEPGEETLARVERIGYLVFAPGMAGGDLDEAERQSRALEAEDPRRARMMLALAQAQDERLDDALATCDGALADEPGDPSLLLVRARLLQELERLTEADAAFAAVLEGPRSEKYYNALYERSRLHLEHPELGGDPAETLGWLQTYADGRPYGDFLPGPAAAHWRMGLCHEALGNPADARRCYEAALAEDPDFEEAEDALDEL